MCGITGCWGKGRPSSVVIERMANRIRHRGPDDGGVWIDDQVGLSLAHRRLSIIDLSPAGQQPMHSPCGRYVLVFNGEIYNHYELRRDLEEEGGAFSWRGHSDTETLLASLRHWGIEGALQRLNGMFAFALWDSTNRTLFLARDRLGEKPLYYGRCGDTFLFGSELKALIENPDCNAELDRDAVALYMRYNYVPAPWSIYRGIHKLQPAHFVAISDRGRVVADPVCYWDATQLATQGSLAESAEFLTDELNSILNNSINMRMMSDVPLGAFLSGGVDSTTVVALMQAQSARPIKTFSIGFSQKEYDEAVHARAVAEHLKTDHTELYITPKQAMDVIPHLPEIYDEPFSDPSQIPTFLVSRLAREHVTVSLSGDGGDELFFGYDRYFRTMLIWEKIRLLPHPFRKVLAELIRRAPTRVFEKAQHVLPRHLQIANLSDRLQKLAEKVVLPDGQAFYRSMISHTNHPKAFVLGASEPETVLSMSELLPPALGLPERMMLLDVLTYLPDDILAKVDRASMAVGLEARVPLLDHRIVEFALRLPMDMKFRDGQGKWLLRQVLSRYVPNEIMERPKKGFGIPIEYWLRDELRDWAESLLDEKRLREEGVFDPVLISQMWQEHLSGQRRWHRQLWNVLMFQAWSEAR